MGLKVGAWRVHAAGEPRDVLRWDEVVLEDPGPGQLLVRVEAAAVNFVDLLLCRGIYQDRPAHPFTPGGESCGRVVAAGEGCATPVGARVIAAGWVPGAGLAEALLVPEELTFPLGDDVDPVKGAALHTAYSTAVVCLERRGRLQAGETLLVNAGAGSVGSAAIQVGQAMGATVVATAGGPAKVEVCRSLGAVEAFDSHRDFSAAVRAATGGRGADVVYDSVGGQVFDWSRRCVAFEGRILVIGFASGDIPCAPTNHALLKGYSVVGAAAGLYRDRDVAYWRACHDRVVEMFRAGALDPLLDPSELTLADAPEALERLARRRNVGKLVLRVV
ncbi:MAG: NADPH:quinone oxidoreductase family protein [Acidimicrobiia bacterium]